MLTRYYIASNDLSPGSGLRIRRLGVRVLLGVFFLLSTQRVTSRFPQIDFQIVALSRLQTGRSGL